MATTYTIKVLAAGTADMGGMIYDFSGSSYHYNSDWSASILAVTAVEQANLSLSKSDSPNTVTAGQNVTYTLDVANAGPSTAHGVTISDPLPPGTSFVSADNGGSLAGGTVTWNLGDVGGRRDAERAPGGEGELRADRRPVQHRDRVLDDDRSEQRQQLRHRGDDRRDVGEPVDHEVGLAGSRARGRHPHVHADRRERRAVGRERRAGQ